MGKRTKEEFDCYYCGTKIPKGSCVSLTDVIIVRRKDPWSGFWSGRTGASSIYNTGKKEFTVRCPNSRCSRFVPVPNRNVTENWSGFIFDYAEVKWTHGESRCSLSLDTGQVEPFVWTLADFRHWRINSPLYSRIVRGLTGNWTPNISMRMICYTV